MNTGNPRKRQVGTVLLLVAAALLGLAASCGKGGKEEGPVVSVLAAPAQKGQISRLVAAEADGSPARESTPETLGL